MSDRILFSIGEALIDMIPSRVGCSFDEVPAFSPRVGGAPANVCAAVALLLMNFSKNGKTVDDSRAWLKRIAITWAILNGLGFIMAYVTPFFSGGQWTA